MLKAFGCQHRYRIYRFILYITQCFNPTYPMVTNVRLYLHGIPVPVGCNTTKAMALKLSLYEEPIIITCCTLTRFPDGTLTSDNRNPNLRPAHHCAAHHHCIMVPSRQSKYTSLTTAVVFHTARANLHITRIISET